MMLAQKERDCPQGRYQFEGKPHALLQKPRECRAWRLLSRCLLLDNWDIPQGELLCQMTTQQQGVVLWK
jgi:hypothetical protein